MLNVYEKGCFFKVLCLFVFFFVVVFSPNDVWDSNFKHVHRVKPIEGNMSNIAMRLFV